MTLEQLKELAQMTQDKLRQVESLISSIESLPQDADTDMMMRALLDVQLEVLKGTRNELLARLESIRPALSNIIIATPAPGSRQ